MRECATALLYVAKRENIPVFLIGHVTKVMHGCRSALLPRRRACYVDQVDVSDFGWIVNCCAGLDIRRASCSSFGSTALS